VCVSKRERERPGQAFVEICTPLCCDKARTRKSQTRERERDNAKNIVKRLLVKKAKGPSDLTNLLTTVHVGTSNQNLQVHTVTYYSCAVK
jgi:hypothetical protein